MTRKHLFRWITLTKSTSPRNFVSRIREEGMLKMRIETGIGHRRMVVTSSLDTSLSSVPEPARTRTPPDNADFFAMNILLICFSLVGATAAARRVPRQYHFYPFTYGDYYQQLPLHPVAFAQEPYPNSGYSAPFASASCRLIPASGEQITGEIFFSQANSLSPVEVTGTIFGLSPGLHGFHIHQNGNTSDDCKAAGGHFNPANKNHGAPEDAVRHAGDLGNVAADANGFVSLNIVDHEISLVQGNPRQIVGRAVVVHAKEDDLGKGNDSESLKTGNAGSRVACCVIDMPTYKNA